MDLDNLSILKAVFESTADGLLLVGSDGKVIQYNSRFHELWKIPKDILDTKDDDKLLGYILGQLSYPEKFISKVKELYQDPEAISNDTIEFTDGRFFERFSRPLKVDTNTVGRVWSFRDVTAHKKSKEVFVAITDLSPDIVSILNPEGILVFNSSAAERIHGYEKDELLGKNTMSLVYEEDRPNVEKAFSDLLQRPGGITTVQYRYLNKDNSYSWMEATASNQIQNPLIEGVVTISREIGERKKLEEDLGNALKMRDEFISIASHELKTPITSIKLQLQMLQRSKKILGPEVSSNSKAEDLPGLLDQVHSLQRLIDDLLSVSRIRTGKLSIEPAMENLTLIVQALITRYEDLFSEVGCELKLSLSENVLVNCDKTRIEQVFINLISNAIKYAASAPVEISLTESESTVEFKIKDHGKGIHPDKYDEIFGLFERGSNKNYVNGLGIGLYISRSIIEAHKGTIHVESTIDKGSTFIVRLPKSF